MSFWQKIDKPIIGLSPMDGITDASFRFIAAKHGRPDVTFTEFVNVETAFFAIHTLIKDLTYSEIERPVVAQIYGHTPQMFYKIAHIVCELGFDGLDINMGCPAKKVAAKGSGAALIRTPELAQSIIRTTAQGIKDWSDGQKLSDLNISPELIQKIAISNRLRTGVEAPPRRSPIPVSVKTRLGFDRVVVEEWIRTLLEEKPSVISLHGRTLKQKYQGKADWEAIARAAEVARNSATLILGNGDLQATEDVYWRVRESHVHGVLLGRGAQGNPWVFRSKDEVKRALRSECAVPILPARVSLEERFGTMLEHSAHFEKHWGIASFVGMRKHLAWYCKGLHGAAELRSQLVRVSSIDDVVKSLRKYANSATGNFEPAAAAWPV